MDTISVLLIDDSEETIETLSLIYGSNVSFRVVGRALQADDAMSKIEQYRPNLISIDLQLGDENGFSLTEQIHARYPDIFIVMCTVMSDTATREEARQNGVDYFVSKPMSMRELGRIRTAYVDREYRSLYRHALDTRHDLRSTDLLLSRAAEGPSRTGTVIANASGPAASEYSPATHAASVDSYSSAASATHGTHGNEPKAETTVAPASVATADYETFPMSDYETFHRGAETTSGIEMADPFQTNVREDEIEANAFNGDEVTDVADAVNLANVADINVADMNVADTKAPEAFHNGAPQAQTRMSQAELLSFLGSIAIGEDTEPLYARIQELEHENASLHAKLDAIQKLLKFGDE